MERCEKRRARRLRAATLAAVSRTASSARGWLRLLVAAAIVVVAVIVLVPSLSPFGSRTIDRSGPAVLRSIENLGELRASSANLELIVDVEEDDKLLPSILKGERTLLIAAGTVDGVVDLTALDDDAIEVSSDRRAVTITLPHAQLGDAQLDHSRTRVFDRDRGLVDRVEDLVVDNPTDEQELYLLAGQRLKAAAAADPEVLRRAEENTRATLTGLLKGLGFETVEIRFEDPPGL